MNNTVFLLLSVVFSAALLFADTIPISLLHQNNSAGVPTLLGQIVSVQGEVTVAGQFGINAFVEDEAGGVAIMMKPLQKQ